MISSDVFLERAKMKNLEARVCVCVCVFSMRMTVPNNLTIWKMSQVPPTPPTWLNIKTVFANDNISMTISEKVKGWKIYWNIRKDIKFLHK